MKNKSVSRPSKLDVGHPVVTESGACGIITEKHLGGIATVDLIGGSTVRVVVASLKDYFLTPFLVKPQTPQLGIQRRVRTKILQEKFLLFLQSCQESVPITSLVSIAIADGGNKGLANAAVYQLLAAKQICRSGERGHYQYRSSFRDEKPDTVVKEQCYG